MGCDIHAVIEKKGEYNTWKNMGDPEIGRIYTIFAVLANVRNSDGIPSIAAPRGVPEDCSSIFNAWVRCWEGGGHSHSWVTLEELKEYDIEQEYTSTRQVLSRDAKGQITATCSRSTGPTLGMVGKTKVFGVWGPQAWLRLIERMEKIGGDDEVRLVFFFTN